MNRRKAIFFLAYIAIVILVVLPISVVLLKETGDKDTDSGLKEKFEELEFVVIHRPHLTYFVDMKYFLCFATRKPDYQDLVQFVCPERMWKDVEESLQGKAVKHKDKK